MRGTVRRVRVMLTALRSRRGSLVLTALRSRRAVAVGCAFVLMLLAGPAMASAPQCDTRGATTFAPAPTLQAPLASIDATRAGTECVRGPFLDALSGHRQTTPDPRTDVPQAVFALFPLELRAASIRLAISPAVPVRAHPGVKTTLDRPPRR